MNFASDNTAGIAAPILEAIGKANTGYALGYGNDDCTRRVERRFAELFEHEVAVFLVPTGTAANALALAHLTPPWGAVLCHAESHVATDECGAPEFFGGGIKLVGLKGEGAKVSAETLRRALDEMVVGGLETTLPLHRRLVNNEDIQKGEYDIHWLEGFLKSQKVAEKGAKKG